MVCHSCSREIKIIGAIRRKDECPHCQADVYVCKNCRFFDPGRSNQCTESQADYVADKNRANFCDYFQPNNRVALVKKSSTAPSAQDDVKKAFDALFKKK
jgi:hypothetical protein